MIGSEALVRAMERRIGEDCDYMRDAFAVGARPGIGLIRLAYQAMFHRHADKRLVHLARIGATAAEDCGPCLRIAVKTARQAGVADDVLRAALAGGDALSGDDAIAYRFGLALSARDPNVDALGDAIEARLGRRVRTELALAAALVRSFPALKRGLGYGQSCSVTRFDDL